MRFRNQVISIFQFITRCLDYICPKNHRLVIFGSFGGRYPGGNSKPVFDYLRKLPQNPLKCYYFLNTQIDEPGFVGMRPFSLKTYLIFLRAKTIVTTHSLWDFGILRPSRRKYWIRLWHGHSGPKADGWPSKRFTVKDRRNIEKTASSITKFLVTSRLNLYFWAYSLLLHPYQLLPLGFPRNDILVSKEKHQPKLLDILMNLPVYKLVLLYAPTYRANKPTEFFPFDDYDPEDLKNWLEENNMLLLLRHHMSEESEIGGSERIRYLDSNICREVNEILPEVDILITDYSSIASDFLLLSRFIIYVTEDIEEFEEQEGFHWGNFDFWTPGPKVRTYKEFKESVQMRIEGNDEYVERRQIISQLINEYQTANSSERVALFLIHFLTEGEEKSDKYGINFIQENY